MAGGTASPTAADYLGAIALAVIASGDLETMHKVIETILAKAPELDGDATWPTKILVDSIREAGASFTT